MSEDMMAQLTAALDGHDVTNDEGDISEERETFVDDSVASEPTTLDEDSATGENPADSDDEDTQSSDDDVENQLAEDDSGKRYVPEKRFKGVYAKMKDYERKLQEREALAAQGEQLLRQSSSKGKKSNGEAPIDKADILELKMTLPQFNPASKEFDPVLDKLGFQILRANPGMTPIQAGQTAIEMARTIADRRSQTTNEARAIKSQQSDQGMTTRVVSRQGTQPDVDKMSVEEMEDFMKQNGMW
jgi:hypothetical protein